MKDNKNPLNAGLLALTAIMAAIVMMPNVAAVSVVGIAPYQEGLPNAPVCGSVDPIEEEADANGGSDDAAIPNVCIATISNQQGVLDDSHLYWNTVAGTADNAPSQCVTLPTTEATWGGNSHYSEMLDGSKTFRLRDVPSGDYVCLVAGFFVGTQFVPMSDLFVLRIA